MKARESLPLLPSVVRGPDGLLQLGGARASDTPLFIDGFNVTNPATGISSINLPFEAVKAVDVLRDPMAVTYGDLVGGLVQIRSTSGADRFKFGVQGLGPATPVHQPRLRPPRGHLSPRLRWGRASQRPRPLFRRRGIRLRTDSGPGSDRQQRTRRRRPERDDFLAAGCAGDAAQQHEPREPALSDIDTPQALSPRRQEEATTDFHAHDRFVGFTDRFVIDDSSVLTIQASALTHDTRSTPNGEGVSSLSPDGWRNNWFAAVERRSVRYGAKAAWQQTRVIGSTPHDFTVAAEFATRRLRGSVVETSIEVLDVDGRLVRQVDFAPRVSSIHSEDTPLSFSARDVWQPAGRLTVDCRNPG
jgi:hypothetical protein